MIPTARASSTWAARSPTSWATRRAEWLERPERVKEEEPAKLFEALKLKPGDVVADVGAGSGYHVFLMSPAGRREGESDRRRHPAGDARPHHQQGQEAERRPTSRRCKGTATDPKLPASSVDLILLVDVYHEFDHPFEMTEKMVAALKPGGRLVFVEFRMEDAKVPIKLVHKMSERQVLKEMGVFREMEHTKTFETLPWQHVIVFTKKEPKK